MTTYKKRTYICDDCSTTDDEFRFTTFVATGDTSIPDCPRCKPNTTPVTGFPHVRDSTNHKSKAIDLAQNIAEKEFGLSNIRDNQYAGAEGAYITPSPPTSRETQARMQLEAEIAQQTSTQAANLMSQFNSINRPAGWADTGFVGLKGTATITTPEAPSANTIVGAMTSLKNKPLGTAVSANYTG
jgi:hypothetical protein